MSLIIDAGKNFDFLGSEEFLANYWRQSPVLIKGAGRDFLNLNLTDGVFKEITERLRKNDDPNLTVIDREAVFIERFSDYVPKLGDAAASISKSLGSPLAWFDATQTFTNDGGLGEHFDHSDNFVILLEGNEKWTLSSPDTISRETIALRMLGVEGVGAAPLPKNGRIEFELEAGDILYMPLFWIHSGLSIGKTLSLSLSVPALSLKSVFTRAINETFTELGLGYQPVPFISAAASGRDREQTSGQVQKAMGVLAQKLQDPAVIKAVGEKMTQLIS